MDIVTQGTSVPHAFRMASEAVALAVSEDLAEGLDPRHREQSDDVYWQTMDEVMRDGESGSLGEERAVLAAVAVLNLTVATEPKLTMPDAWMIAKLDHGSPSRRHS